MFVTKTDRAKELYQDGRFKEALYIFKTFRIDVDKDERRTLEIAYGCLTGSESFYKSLGFDCKIEVNNAKQIIEKKWMS